MKEMLGPPKEDKDEDEDAVVPTASPLRRTSTEPVPITRPAVVRSVSSTSLAEVSHNGAVERSRERRLTPYERLSQDLSQDPRVMKEITLGKRIGFYRIRGELGSGNFSQVKLGIHSLTKGS